MTALGASATTTAGSCAVATRLVVVGRAMGHASQRTGARNCSFLAARSAWICGPINASRGAWGGSAADLSASDGTVVEDEVPRARVLVC